MRDTAMLLNSGLLDKNKSGSTKRETAEMD
jgi:hypothetical protein